jgi:hypothetical protein
VESGAASFFQRTLYFLAFCAREFRTGWGGQQVCHFRHEEENDAGEEIQAQGMDIADAAASIKIAR